MKICKNCYGKGYSTEFAGVTTAYADFSDSKTHILRPAGVRVRICKCDRGKQIRKYFTLKEQFKRGC